MKTLIATTLAALALVGAAPASAEYSYSELTRGICAYLDGQPSMAALNSVSRAANHANWPAGAMGVITGAAIRQVCPMA